MITSKIFFFSEGVVRDAISNTISAYNIIEEYHSPGFPFFIQKCFIFCLLHRDSEDPNPENVQIILKNNDTLLHTISNIKVDFSGSKRNRIVAYIDGMVIPQPGTLNAILQINEKNIAEYKIDVSPIVKPKNHIIEANGSGKENKD